MFARFWLLLEATAVQNKKAYLKKIISAYGAKSSLSRSCMNTFPFELL